MKKLPRIEDYEIAIETGALIKCDKLINGKVIKVNDNLVKYVGGFCVVFPYISNSRKYAVRCWFTNVDNIKERSKIISEKLAKLQLPYFIGFEYYEKGLVASGEIQPIILMDWVDARPLKSYIADNLHDSEKLRQLAENFRRMVIDLHNNNISHGDLQHGNIMITNEGDIKLVDYDSMFVEGLESFRDDIKGLEGYQHPSRWQNPKSTPKADYFSELVIYTSIIALSRKKELWDRFDIQDTETMLFSEEDIKSNGSSEIFSILEADAELQKYSLAMKKALETQTIDQLLPLERAIVSEEEKREEIASCISNKWNDNGYKPIVSATDFSEEAGKISSGWINNDVENTKPKEDYSNEALEIRNKW